jgi:hypothetical protein
VIRPSSREELGELCRGIRTSFVHLETRDAYGTETELPHLAKWRRGEPDDYAWLGWWLDMLRSHRAAGRTCRRIRVVSEPLSEYQRWILSHVRLFVEAGEDIRYVPRPRLDATLLPGGGDFYVFDDELIMLLHYADTGLNAGFELSDDPWLLDACQEVFETAWDLGVPAGDYHPA